MRATILYALWRVLLFAVPFGVLYGIGFQWYIALVVALIVSFSVSYIFLGKLRAASAAELFARRERKLQRHDDEDAEDGESA